MFPEEAKKEEAVLKLSTRKKVYDIVHRHAGCHFREIERLCRMPHGLVKYHLDYLSRHDLIRQRKLGNNVRYFPKNLRDEEKKLLGVLRSSTSRQIIIFMYPNRRVSHKDVAGFVGLSPPTVSWHLKRLIENNVVQTRWSGGETRYSLKVEKDLVIKLLIAYQKSFFDSLVDRTIETWG